MQDEFKFVLAIHDGEAAGSPGASETSGTAASTTDGGSTQQTESVSKAVTRRAKQLGLSDDLVDSYNAAFGSGNKNNNTDNSTNAAGEPEETAESDNLDSEFEEAINGKYRAQYQNKMRAAVLDRVHQRDEQIAKQKSQLDKANGILEVLANKYPNIKSDDYEGLLKAVRADESIFTQTALDSGITVKEALKAFDDNKAQKAQQSELESLRAEKARNRLNVHLRELSQQTKAEYPDFDLDTELANPSFRRALDFVAKENQESNKARGKNDEIFNLTQAYEMAHFDELKSKIVKSSAKAALGAASQHIASGAKRPVENANVKRVPAQSKRFTDMDIHSREFEQFIADVKAGKKHI